MSIELQWTIEGERQLSRRIRTLSKNLGDLSVPFEDTAKTLQKVYERDVFKSKGSVILEKWRRLSPATVARKARSGGSILVETGKMQRSFKHRSAKDHAIIWNTSEYFKYHQSNAPRRKLPRRVMLKLAEPQRKIVQRMFTKHLNKILKKK